MLDFSHNQIELMDLQEIALSKIKKNLEESLRTFYKTFSKRTLHKIS